MKLIIKHQDSFSRGELLLRIFFGVFYIDLPHIFLLSILGIWSGILTFLSMWIILFTGRYPESFFEFQVKLYRWQVRWRARSFNLSDGYPAFGLNASDEYTSFDVDYPESVSRGLTLARMFFGVFYVGFPHMFVLMFAGMWGAILRFIAWWAVLFTGSYPESMHEFNVGLIRWGLRVSLYLGYMTDQYPPFTGKEMGDEGSSSPSSEPTPAPEPADSTEQGAALNAAPESNDDDKN